MDLTNTGLAMGHCSGPELINTVDVNIPLAQLGALYPEIQRFTASICTFSYHPKYPKELRILAIQRNGKDSSWGNTWETGGGTPEPKDKTILYSAAREGFEETGIWPSKFAPDALTYSFDHRDRKTDEMKALRTIGFIQVENDEDMAQRIWCSDKKTPVGQSSVRISDEHLDHCWFTERQIRDATVLAEEGHQEPFTMLQGKKDMILSAFELFKRYKSHGWSSSINIARKDV